MNEFFSLVVWTRVRIPPGPHNVGSSKGRTSDFDSENGSSNLSPTTKEKCIFLDFSYIYQQNIKYTYNENK